jgi:hypothetical protein
MAQLKDFQVGSAGDPVTVGGVLTVQAGAVGTPAITTAGDTNTGIFFPAADTIAFAEGGVEAMRLDSSGNMGLGVTPSAFGSNKAIQVGNSGFPAVIADIGGDAFFGSNAYNDGVWRYRGTYNASLLRQSVGAFAFFTAPSGTAGNAITFTQAMTLDADGDLGIGTTSPSNKLHIYGASGTAFIKIEDSGGITGKIQARSGTSLLEIGTTSNHGTAFYTNNTERARIDSSGNLLVGVTSNPNTARSYFRYDGMTTQIIVNSATTTAASTSWTHFLGQSGDGSSITTNNIFIYGNGNIQNANNSYGSLSDIKLKENIVDATPKLDKLMQVRIRNYNLKGDYEQHKQLGVVAQELEAVFPAMVEETSDKDMEGNDLGTTTKSVKYSVFVPMLIKAIQEQQTLITQLQADVAALKA